MSLVVALEGPGTRGGGGGRGCPMLGVGDRDMQGDCSFLVAFNFV